ncbi:MAG: mono/diheme cytochrome c family protein [Saprospiraceae bacterium]|jgi:mono/diheme cytochrome c family protein
MKKFPFIIIAVLCLFFGCEYQPYSQGGILYKNNCANCHMEDGSGLKGLIPPLAKADFLKDNQAQISCIIKNGIKGAITVNGRVYDTEMAGIQSLNEVQINNVINYINHAWGNDFGDSNVADVTARLEECKMEY